MTNVLYQQNWVKYQVFGIVALIFLVCGVYGGEAASTGRDRHVDRALLAYESFYEMMPVGKETRQGFMLLRQGELDQALKTFEHVLSQEGHFAPAHYGMALASYRLGGATGDKAAYVQRTRYHAEKAAVLYPKFEGPYRLLGDIQLDVLDDPNRATDAFVRSLEADPTMDHGVLKKTAVAFLQTGSLTNLEPGVLDSLRVSEKMADILPLVAQACLDRNSPDLAVQYFGRYFALLPAHERAYYQDIAWIATDEEQKAFRRVTADPLAKREFVMRFWAGRDPDLLTQVNERQITHYQRVWFARANFSSGQTPWDRRGDVYVRYGPPDYRSKSNQPTPPMTAAVERIKERLSVALYGEEGLGEISAGPTFPILVQKDPGMNFADLPAEGLQSGSAPLPVDDLGIEQEIVSPDIQAVQRGETSYDVTLERPYGRVGADEDVSFVRWESWVYTAVGGGIEIVFTDHWGSGNFGYAPVPPPDPSKTDAVSRMGRLVRHSPQMVVAESVKKMPEYYMPGGPESFLNFYYDHAKFRGKDGKTRLEIYYGLPPKALTETVKLDTTFVFAGCAAALMNNTTGEMVMTREETRFRTQGYSDGQGDFLPNLLALDVLPGDYTLRVQVKDLVTGKSGIYKEELTVTDFSKPELSISDLHMGFEVSLAGGREKYKKGEIWVLPMTTKAYTNDQNPFVYYQVYNLSKDNFGQSKFRLDYTVQFVPEKTSSFGRLMASVGRVFRREGNPEVSVSTDQVRSETDLEEFFELNLKQAKGGVNRLTVTVTDLQNGSTTQNEVLFRFD